MIDIKNVSSMKYDDGNIRIPSPLMGEGRERVNY